MGGLDGASAIFLIVGFATAGLLLLLFLQFGAQRGDRNLRSRISKVTYRATALAGGGAGQQTADLRKAEGSFKSLESLAMKVIPRPALMRQRLSQTGRNISLGQYVLICVGVAVGSFILRHFVFYMPILPGILVSIVAGLALPHAFVGFLISRRIKKFLADFPEAIDLIVRGLKSGLPVPESIRVVGEEFGDPVGKEFGIISESVKFGQTLDEALWDAVKRLNIPDFKFFVVSLAVQRETGGNLSETLENLSDILRRRRQMKLKIKALSAEAKVSAMILGSLPFVMFGIMAVLNASYAFQLFTDPRGHLLIGFAFACLAIGVAVMWKMVRFEI